MLIDWFTVIAQLLNFIILIWLLKRFLYKPVLKALDERENLISKQINDAELKMTDARKELETYQEKNSAFEQQRKSLLNEAKDEANAKREELITEAKKESDELRSRLNKSIASDQQQIGGGLMNRAASEVFAIARKTLKDLASMDVEERMIGVFVDRLRKPEVNEREQMQKAFGSSSQQITVFSSFEISTELQTKIIDAIEEYTVPGSQIDFKVAPEQISGIELVSNSYKVTWSIADYLTNLESNVVKTLKHSDEVSTKKEA